MEIAMKKLLAVCLLMLCLSFPAFAGHTLGGGYACSCGTAGCFEDFPGECGGHHTANQQSKSPSGSFDNFMAIAKTQIIAIASICVI
jgi:hypothetical protein